MSKPTTQNISGGKDDLTSLEDAAYLAARKLVNAVESSSVEVSEDIRRKSGSNVLADAVKVDKCPPELVGCNASELFKATGGELTCPDLSMAPDPLIVDSKGRVCYAEKDILNHWTEVGPDGKKRYKQIDIDALMNKYSQQLLDKFMDPSNKKLLIAASQAARNGFNIPPIILNYYKYNPFVEAFCDNASKGEKRLEGALVVHKDFRGLKAFTTENGYAKYQTKEIFGTILSNFTNNLDIDTGAEFVTIMMRPVIRAPTVRGMFDIYCTNDRSIDLDFLNIEAYSRSAENPPNVIHAVNANVCELMFTSIAATSRDTTRVKSLQKFLNSLGQMLKFGELAPEYESPENQCRQAGVAANNAIQFLPIVLKEWLSSLPSTWRYNGPDTSDPGDDMIQRKNGDLPRLHSESCGGAGVGGSGGEAGEGGGSGSVLQNVAGRGGEGGGGSGGGAGGILGAVGQRDFRAGEVLQGGASTLYEADNIVETVAHGRRMTANPPTVTKTVNDVTSNVQDPRIILQNFIALCFYLNWVETYSSASQDSIISTFKSLRVSYEAAMHARQNVEKLLKIRADEAAKRREPGTYKSAVTENMVEEAIAAKRGADASYLGTNVRIAERMARLLDIGWEKCKSDSELQSPSYNLTENSWYDKMLPHQELKKVDIAQDIRPGNLRFTVQQLPGLGANDLNPVDKTDQVLASNEGTRHPDYPDSGPQESYASNLIYQNMIDPLGDLGINTRNFRTAWKNTTIAFNGIKTKKHHISRIGYKQLMSRMMNFHLTFAQSCSSGRKYFIKMYEYSMMQSRRNGIPEDPRADFSLFDDPGHEQSIYKSFAATTTSLLKPLDGFNVCKVVTGENQYFVFKNTSLEDQVPGGKQRAREQLSTRMAIMYSKFRNTFNEPDWYQSIISLADNEPNVQQAYPGIGYLAQFIIEESVEYRAEAPGQGRGAVSQKSFSACEPLDTSDFYMLARRKRTLDVDRPEDELFMLGIEGIAKYTNQTTLFGNVQPDPNVARRNSPPAVDRNNAELLKVKDTHLDTIRRKSNSQGLNADERDWYARFSIFLFKVSGGNPYRLAQYLLEVQEADTKIDAFNTIQTRRDFTWPFGFADYVDSAGQPVVGRTLGDATLREGIAMRILWLVRNPSPLFASVSNNLMGGKETEGTVTAPLPSQHLQGGSSAETQVQIQTETQTQAQVQEQAGFESVAAVDTIEADVDYLLTGGLGSSPVNKIPVAQQHDPPRHIREAMLAARNQLSENERQLDLKLQKLGKRPIIHYNVGEKCPVSLSKYNNLFGKPGGSQWVETTHPWTQCQEKMGFQFKTRNGYCYPMDDKCYDPTDVKLRTKSTLEKLQHWQEFAKINNAIDQDKRERALQANRVQILKQEANRDISHTELEEMAHRMLPEELRMLPDKVAMQAIVSVSEDLEGQVREHSDSSDEHQKKILRDLLTSSGLLEEEWDDSNQAQKLENLDELVKDLVSNAKLCADMSIAIRNQSSDAELRQNLRGALNYSTTLNTVTPSLKSEFVQSLSEESQVSIRSPLLAEKCEARDLYERDGILVPVRINARINTDENAGVVSRDGLITWWKEYHASTRDRKTRQLDKLSSAIDPNKKSEGGMENPNKEETLQRQLEKALDREGLNLLEGKDVRSSRHFRSRSRSRSRTGGN